MFIALCVISQQFVLPLLFFASIAKKENKIIYILILYRRNQISNDRNQTPKMFWQHR